MDYIGLHWGYIGIVVKTAETTILYRIEQWKIN